MNRAINLGPAALGGALGAGQIIPPEDAAKFLNGEGEFATPAGGSGSPGGAVNELQVNDGAGGFSAVTGFAHDGSALSVAGSVSLPEGSGIKIGFDTGSGSATNGFVTLDGAGMATVTTSKIGPSGTGGIVLTPQGSGNQAVGTMTEKAGTRNSGSDFTIISSAGALDSGVDVYWLITGVT